MEKEWESTVWLQKEFKLAYVPSIKLMNYIQSQITKAEERMRVKNAGLYRQLFALDEQHK